MQSTSERCSLPLLDIAETVVADVLDGPTTHDRVPQEDALGGMSARSCRRGLAVGH